MTSDLFFEHIEEHFSKTLPMVAYRKPNELVVNAMLQRDDTINYSIDFVESGFVFAPFDDRNDAILIPSDTSKFIQCEEYSFRKENIKEYESSTNELKKQHHINLVQNGINVIQDGAFEKIVLSRCETLVSQDYSPIEIFKSLLNTYTSALVYIWYHPKIGLWIGATPETLLDVQGQRLRTMSLAGTQLNNSETINWKEKEKTEQQLVTDYIVSELQSMVSHISTSEVKTIQAGPVVHLQTEIEGRINSNLKDIIKALHPTPAVCGLPKAAAKAFIIDQENYDREFYTGFLGELNIRTKQTRNTNRRNVENNAYRSIKKVSKLFVNLRCLQCIDDKILLYVGGGITKDSNAEDEWIETINKAETIKRILD